MAQMLRRSRTVSDSADVVLPQARLEPDLANLGISEDELLAAFVERHAIERHRAVEVREARIRSGRALDELLVEAGVSERELIQVFARLLPIPVADLRSMRPSPEAVAFLPESLVRAYDILPISIEHATLWAVIPFPFQDGIVEALESLPLSTIHVGLAARSEIRVAVNQVYRALADVHHNVSAFAEAAPALQPTPAELTAAAAGDDAPVIQIVNKIVTQALRDRASDVHIEPMDDRVRVRFRIDGALKEELSLPASLGPSLVSRIKILADMNIVERRRPQDGQFEMTVDGRGLDVRVATTATIWGEKAVLRLLDKTRSLYRLSDLGMPAHTAARYQGIVESPHGMVIASGPTGSGKTTTLYATLNQINRADINVTTIEDPVEYVLPTVNQIQVNEQAGVTFAAGLRSILRQDPDIVLVGEMRDIETARIAVQSALTGHLVLTSLHSVDSVSAIYRLLDMGIESFLIASSVLGVVAQRLVRRNCAHCLEEYMPSSAELAFAETVGGLGGRRFLRGAGCQHCAETGFFDRVGVYEVLLVSDDIRQLVVAGASPRDVRNQAQREGLSRLRNEGLRLVGDGVTTIDEVMRNVYVAEGQQ